LPFVQIHFARNCYRKGKEIVPEMTTLNSVLIIGATGHVGFACCKEVLKLKASFKRIAAFNNTARPSAAKEAAIKHLQTNGFEIVSSDNYDKPELYKGFDVVVMALGNFANYLQPQIIDAAIKGGVRHFYPSEFGADITVGENWTQRYYRDKVLTREHLMKRAAELDDKNNGNGGLGWSYVTIGRLTEWGVTSYFGFDHEQHTASIYGTEDGRQSLINIDE
jgi:hypothetical protein